VVKTLVLGVLLLALAGCAGNPRHGADTLGASTARTAVDGGTGTARGSDIVLTAFNFLDKPYRYGGNGEVGFDCSGFTRHVYERSLGMELPRSADDQAGAEGLVNVRREQLVPGDLVFFNTLNRTFSHVGIYVGQGRFVHAPKTGAQIRVDDMRTPYWSRRYTGARRASERVAEASNP
jgi:cell wall-associated NlpC family hydrolase